MKRCSRLCMGCVELHNHLNHIEADKERAIDRGICSAAEIKKLMFSIGLACQMMHGQKGMALNYGLTIGQLIDALQSLDGYFPTEQKKPFSMSWPYVFE